jgi:hypothetical protein
MFELLEEDKPREQEPTNYTGLIVALISLPVFFLFKYFGRTDLALPAFVYAAMTLLAIGIRWKLRTRPWFWAVIALVVALHTFLLFRFTWPHFQVSKVSLLPIGLADLLIILGIIWLVENFIVRNPPDEEAI